ncbi:MAG: hypothetical protein UW55_C0048G0003 [Candidatus Giovannonibacteria bacterium GW2011_GWA2_44_26]|uniref:Uncharacterized protein n=1 Tax=Candidatus Giovannonibacteria bacterium GW2011_GWA2_44_26 TaxID=1618648 RepID=A0A0G1INC8_9BACT|nr:MAG: hypothetical protein UW55_C0048G0003 [Candidatus Giovannonibacteria bacterium GW2011_GWA2_44_26]
MNSMIKNFSFLLSVKTWFEPIVFPGSLAVLKSRGEAGRLASLGGQFVLNFRGKNELAILKEEKKNF